MIKKILTIMLVIAFALALTLCLGGCKDKDIDDDDDDMAWEDDDDWDLDDEDWDFDDDDWDGEVDPKDFGLDEMYEPGVWPDNEYTRQIPKPDFDNDDSFVEDGEFTTTLLDVSLDDARKLSDQMQAAGFTKNLIIVDITTWTEALKAEAGPEGISDEAIAEYLEQEGLEDEDIDPTFNFEADNSDWYHMEFYWWYSTNEVLLSISKP